MTAPPDSASPPLAFGPVPSRRLGRSLGINNIPPKVCSFACLYCQVGPTLERDTELQTFYEPERLADVVAHRVADVRDRGERIDYLTFVPDGEPTLDARLAATMDLLRPLNVPIAVITNGSLLWRDDVRSTLGSADWVSVKVDAAVDEIWRHLNRPDPVLDFTTVFDGIAKFASEYTGDLVSETMLVAGINDDPADVEAVGVFLHDAGFTCSYLSIPTRPTPYAAITAPDEATVNRAYQVLPGSSNTSSISSAMREMPSPRPAIRKRTCSASPPFIRCAHRPSRNCSAGPGRRGTSSTVSSPTEASSKRRTGAIRSSFADSHRGSWPSSNPGPSTAVDDRDQGVCSREMDRRCR